MSLNVYALELLCGVRLRAGDIGCDGTDEKGTLRGKEGIDPASDARDGG